MTGDPPGNAPAVTLDTFYGGRLSLKQFAKGHRSGTDAVLLVAAAPAGPIALCYDIGAGVGAVGLGVALLRPVAEVVLVERDSATALLASANVAALGGGVHARVERCDVLDRAALRATLPDRADLVLTNPPFHDAARGRPSPDPMRRAARHLDEGYGLVDWLSACLDRLRQGGTLVAIVSAPVLPGVLAGLDDGAGVTIMPVQPRAAAPARRVLVRAQKGSRKPFTLAAPLVLHDGEGRFTPEVERLHRGDDALAW